MVTETMAMHTTTIFMLILQGLLMVFAQTPGPNIMMQLNYYSDQYCADYSQQIDLVYDDAYACINREIQYAGSMNIAGCTAPDDCYCWWYTQPNCGGTQYYSQWWQG